MSNSSGGRRLWGAITGLLCAIVILGPALKPGYLLFYDMVFVPKLGLTDRTFGTDGSVPRAVPNDLVVALLSQVAPGWLVQKLILLAIFVGVSAGVAGLMRSRLGAVAAGVAACWNPYVAERLAIGHWGFLLGYACLPWVATAAAACRDGRRYGRARLATALVIVALTGSTGAVLALVVVACVFIVSSGRARERATSERVSDLVWIFIIAVLANAPWWYPFLVVAPEASADASGVEAFMARADTPFGVLPSLLTGGGIWNRGVWFSERGTVLIAAAALIGVTAVMVAWVRGRCWKHHPAGEGLTLAAVVGLVMAGLSSVVGGTALVTWIVTSVPGGGLMRDSQKFVALWVLLLAVAIGTLSEAVRTMMTRHETGRAASVMLALALAAWPVVTLPSLAGGALGRWEAVDYPQDQLDLAQRVDSLPEGSVAVFPWTLYRRYDWNDNRVVLDPWQRLIQRDVVVNDDLPLSNRVVRGESLTSARISKALQDHDDVGATMRAAGIRYVLLLTDQPPKPGVPDLSGLRQIDVAGDLKLYDLGTTDLNVAPSVTGADRFTGLGAGALAVLLALGAWLFRPRPRHHRAQPDPAVD